MNTTPLLRATTLGAIATLALVVPSTANAWARPDPGPPPTPTARSNGSTVNSSAATTSPEPEPSPHSPYPNRSSRGHRVRITRPRFTRPCRTNEELTDDTHHVDESVSSTTHTA